MKRVRIGETVYKLVLFRIESKSVTGIPLNCTLIADDRAVDLRPEANGGKEPEFMTAWVPEEMVKEELT